MNAYAERRFRRVVQQWLALMKRRAFLLFWWTITLQLPHQYALWCRARSIRRSAPISAERSPTLIQDTNPHSIALPRSANPTVSVIIPCYGKVEYTLRCLAAIAANPPKAAIEVIVVDDATPDDSMACLGDVPGIRLMINPSNLGYLRSCNAAARIAEGDYLMLLNNDTQVMPGWLDALLESFSGRSDVGAVGSKLLYPNGRLQEAGCIVWDDGSGWNFGRSDSPDRPMYNYLREVDYCSAASLLVPRALFNDLGGFDERYAPAYCEDSDLAFRLREHGYKVLYQPRSHVVHFEGVTHGRSLSNGMKAGQLHNQQKFQARWHSVLSSQHLPNGEHVLRARDRAHGREVVLVVDHYVPEPDRDAGSRTVLCIIRGLLQLGMVVKFWPHNLYFNPGYTETLQALEVEVAYGAGIGSFGQWLAENADDLDYVLVYRPHVAADFLPDLKRYPRIARLYYGMDLHFSRMRLQAKEQSDLVVLRQAQRMETLERSVWRDMDVVLYPSAQESEYVATTEPVVAARTLLPYCFEQFAALRPPPAEPVLLFVGGFAHQPNRHGLVWFLDQVLPIIHMRAPTARLVIVGSNPPADIEALNGTQISVRSNISDHELRELYRTARVAIAPLRYGAGVKLKVVEAMCEGLPLVTTSIGAQGLPGLEEIVSICDEPDQFGDAVCRLLTDDAAWSECAAAQLDYVASRYSEAAFRNSLQQALAQSASRCAARSASFSAWAAAT
jgi:GT2 family glycosyltransferase